MPQVRAAEDLLALSRTLKEAWLFGELNPLGVSEAEKQTDRDSRIVAERLKEMLDKVEANGEEKGEKEDDKKGGEKDVNDRMEL